MKDFKELPKTEQAWQLGFSEAKKQKANIENNPFDVNDECYTQYIRGFNNCMEMLYSLCD